jgi:uncharacterized coiled-coil protein SlyX
MFNNKRIAELEAQVSKLTATIELLNAVMNQHFSDYKNDKENIDSLIEEKIEEAIEQHDFSEAAREALENVASYATFSINF